MSLILALAGFVVLGALIPLFGLDYHVVLFLRSIHIPILEEAGRIGNRLGHGTTLVAISLGLGIFGYGWKHARFKQAMWQSLIAHGISGLLIQIIKHLLGRPRPRFTHQEEWQMGPSFQGGLDAFPSGHSTASFAVAAVLARHFPRGTWVWYGLAAFVALSRIAKGSHFPSDALTGALIGFLVGYLLARPLHCWAESLIEALTHGLPYWVGGFATIWIIFHHPEGGMIQSGMYWGGFLLMMLGAGTWAYFRVGQASNSPGQGIEFQNMAPLLVWTGLALLTESIIVTLLTLLTIVVLWAGTPPLPRTSLNENQSNLNKAWPFSQEVLMGIAIIALIIGIHELKGLIPVQ